MKLRKKINIKPANIIVTIIIIIIIVAFWLLYKYAKNINPKMMDIAEIKINEYTNTIIMDSFNKQIIDDHEINDIIKISKNNQGEIIAVDFDLEKAYLVSINLADNINNHLLKIKNNDQDDIIDSYSKNSFILYLPMGLASNNVYLANLGPKIPIKIEFVDSLTTGLKTKVKDYGINNSLIEVYLKVEVKENIIIPYVQKKIINSCEILLSSQIVEGIVPSIYNGILENNSSLINVPLEK